jgi:hypothetical protein
VHEDVFAAVIADDEAEALLRVKEFYNAGAFANDLRGHAAATAATAAKAAAAIATATAAAIAATTAAAEAIAAAETATATAAAAESITAAEAAAIESATAAAVEIVVAEAVALVSATSTALAAAPSIKTHCPVRLPGSPKSKIEDLTPDEDAGFPAFATRLWNRT